MSDPQDFSQVEPGTEGSTTRVVDGPLTTTHVGGTGLFSTPAMIGLMEITAHRSVEGLLPDGYTTVGYEVCVKHLAPAEPGATVTVSTRLSLREGRRLLFEVSCHEGERLLGTGTHKRTIVPAKSD